MIVDSRLPALMMHAVFHQPLPRVDILAPFKHHADLLHALRQGWVYDAPQGMQLLDQFGVWDLDYRESGVGICGSGVVVWTPDGTALESGADLVAWRDERWARMRAAALNQVLPEMERSGAARKRL